MTIDSKTLDEMDALHAAATAGPITTYPGTRSLYAEINGFDAIYANNMLSAEDAAYTAAACNALPHLTARVRELEAQLAAAREDSARLDWLESEIEREKSALRVGATVPRSLFRQNMAITRDAIDAARGAK